MPDRAGPVGARRELVPVPGVVLDRGLASVLADDAGPDLPRPGLRRGVRRGRMAVGLDDSPPGTGPGGGSAAERDDRPGGEAGRLFGSQAGRPARSPGAVDRHSADEGFRDGVASVRPPTG